MQVIVMQSGSVVDYAVCEGRADQVLTVRLMNEFLHGPLWVVDEDGAAFLEEKIPTVERDEEVRTLSERICDMYDSYYDFDSHDCACWFDEPRERAEASEMLDLAWCLYVRVCELNDGSFNVDDRLIPDLEKKVEEHKRLAKPPDVITSILEGDAYIPVQVTFGLNPGGHRYACFTAGDGSFVEFWIQESTNLPEEFSLFANKSNYRAAKGNLAVTTESADHVCLGFKGNVACKKVEVEVFDDGILISLSDDEPAEWRRAGDVLFGFGESVNLLAIAITRVSGAQIVQINEWLTEG